MVKTFLISFMAVCILAACSTPTVKTVYQEKDVPVPYVPAPPAYSRPVLAVTQLTPTQAKDTGELAKAYAISLTQVLSYSCQLESIIEAYAILAKQNPVISQVSTLPVLASTQATTQTLVTPSLTTLSYVLAGAASPTADTVCSK